MSLRQAILKQLGKSHNTAVERVVEQALTHEAAPEAVDLGRVLLERGRRPGWIALIRHFDRLGEGLQRELMERPRELFGPLAETIDQTTGEARANVIRIVERAADAKLVFLLAEALMDSRAEVRELAAGTLLEAIRKWRIQGYLSPLAPETETASLRKAIDYALERCKTHRQVPAVQAALIFERQQEGPTWAVFEDQYAEATRAGNLLLRNPTDALLAPALLLGLGSALRSAAMQGIASCEIGEMGAALARESFRLIDPVIENAAQAIGNIKALASPKRDVPWTPETWPGWLRLIEHLGLQLPLKLAWLTRMLETPGATSVQKMLTLRAVAALEAPETLQILATYVADADERVARVAARALLSRGKNDAKIYASALAASPHVCVRKLVTLAVGPTRFDKLWSTYTKLPPALQVNSARTLATKETNFPTQLREKLSSVDAGETLQGLRLLGTLPDVRPYRDDIVRLCAHGDPRISSGAVKLVGKLDDPALLDLLEAAARNSDPRVRANAIEAMEELRVANRSQQVLAMLNSRHNRERANAIKAISQFDFHTARETLSKMLLDANPLHRISAMWVVEQLGVLDIVRQVTTLARRDPNAHARGRAAEMVERINGTRVKVERTE